jgi:hypothetical protein
VAALIVWWSWLLLGQSHSSVDWNAIHGELGGGMMTKNKETDPGVDWMPWIAPHDPRRLDNVILMEDEHGRLVASAD